MMSGAGVSLRAWWVGGCAVLAGLVAGCLSEIHDLTGSSSTGGGPGAGGAGGAGGGSSTGSAGGGAGECTPGISRCQGGAEQVCSVSGHWSAPVPCVIGCGAGSCVLVAEMGLGLAHTCARLTDGTVRCWGSSESGQLGDGTIGAGALRPKPAEVPGLANVAQIASGTEHVCARLADGTAKCWGHGGFFKLGNAKAMSSPTPGDVLGLANVAGIALGHSHSCAWLTDGSAKCWGGNGNGQLGIGTTMDAPTPTTVLNLSKVTGMALADLHTCAMLNGGTAACWGEGFSGQLGDGTSGAGAQKLKPSAVPGLSGVAQIAVGAYSSCARLDSGAVACWGANTYGQLGDGSTVDKSTPTPLPGLAQIAYLAPGGLHACALRADGAVFSWGSNAEGQLGDGMAGGDQPTPEAIPTLTKVTGVASGSWHSCAWFADGNVMCWGKNDFGQLGDGSSGGSKAVPTAVKW